MASYSYFDTFSEINIDLTEYLNKLSTSTFKYTFNNSQPIITNIKNLFDKKEIIFDIKKNHEFIQTYEVADNEFIETVSYNVYGDTGYWWIICVFNDIKNQYTDWILSQSQLTTIARQLYETEGKYTYTKYLDVLQENNNKKRIITIPKYSILGDIIWLYRQAVMNQ